MTARGVGIVTIEFPDPDLITYNNYDFETVPGNISFELPIRNNIQTLSAKNADRGSDPFGILFVPDLQSDGCKTSEQLHVPSNATRLRNLPQGRGYALIGLTPWFSPTCMNEYFASARNAQARGLLVYLPGNSASMPPSMNDAAWGLGDGGAWKQANNFPTIALMSISGTIVMHQLSLYSGNVTNAPYADQLAFVAGPTDYVRLWATINIDTGNRLPSLWVFLVIVLGLLILAIVGTSSFMHIVQRRRREALRQRVINGEINLEAVGVKRLTVPREFLEKLPLYTYSGPQDTDVEKISPQVPVQAHAAPSDAETGIKSANIFRRSSAPLTNTQPAEPASAFSQPTCPICIEDFESHNTQVRELPCRHIFHPDCIDTFLLNNSSLCPMCKKSVLPSGYCPARITNVMVRRERMINRMRSRSSPNHSAPDNPVPSAPTHAPRGFGSLGSRIGGAITGRRVFSAPERTRSHPTDIEMAEANAAPPVTPTASGSSGPVTPPETRTANPVPGCSVSPHNRGEWARERALALLGNHDIPASNEDEEHNRPGWKRVLRRVFPGFR